MFSILQICRFINILCIPYVLIAYSEVCKKTLGFSQHTFPKEIKMCSDYEGSEHSLSQLHVLWCCYLVHSLNLVHSYIMPIHRTCTVAFLPYSHLLRILFPFLRHKNMSDTKYMVLALHYSPMCLTCTGTYNALYLHSLFASSCTAMCILVFVTNYCH